MVCQWPSDSVREASKPRSVEALSIAPLRLAPKIAIAVASELAGDDPAVRGERLETLATFLATSQDFHADHDDSDCALCTSSGPVQLLGNSWSGSGRSK